MNQWAASGEKQDEERCDQLRELLEQGEQRYSEQFVDKNKIKKF